MVCLVAKVVCAFHSEQEAAVIVHRCLRWAGAKSSLDSIREKEKDESAEGGSTEKDYTKGTIASALIASIAFAAAFTVPRGFIDDGRPDSGTVILPRRFALIAFIMSDTLAFVCSIVATGFLIYGGVNEVPSFHDQYTMASSYLVPTAAQFMIAAFAFGLHLVLGMANRFLVIFGYTVSSVSVLFVSSNTWIPLHMYGFTKAIWRRAGWKGLLNMRSHPSGPLELIRRLCWSPLAMFSGGSLALPMCVTFFFERPGTLPAIY